MLDEQKYLKHLISRLQDRKTSVNSSDKSISHEESSVLNMLQNSPGWSWQRVKRYVMDLGQTIDELTQDKQALQRKLVELEEARALSSELDVKFDFLAQLQPILRDNISFTKQLTQQIVSESHLRESIYRQVVAHNSTLEDKLSESKRSNEELRNQNLVLVRDRQDLTSKIAKLTRNPLVDAQVGTHSLDVVTGEFRHYCDQDVQNACIILLKELSGSTITLDRQQRAQARVAIKRLLYSEILLTKYNTALLDHSRATLRRALEHIVALPLSSVERTRLVSETFSKYIQPTTDSHAMPTNVTSSTMPNTPIAEPAQLPESEPLNITREIVAEREVSHGLDNGSADKVTKEIIGMLCAQLSLSLADTSPTPETVNAVTRFEEASERIVKSLFVFDHPIGLFGVVAGETYNPQLHELIPDLPTSGNIVVETIWPGLAYPGYSGNPLIKAQVRV